MIMIYSTDNCPKNEIITEILSEQGFEFSECHSTICMEALDISDIPAIQVDEERILTYNEFMRWINDKN